MEPVNIIGAVIGAVLAWIIAALFSKGPVTRMQFLTGAYERRGVGCLGFLFLLLLGAAIGAFVAPALFE